MKKAIKLLSLLLIVGFASLNLACDKKDDPAKSDRDIQIEKLNGTWSAANGEVTLDGDAPSLDYEDFTITIAGTAGNNTITYSTTGRPAKSPWPQSGNLTFGTNVKETLLRDGDDVEITYAVTDNTLTMEFQYTGAGYDARTANVSGTWVFSLTKQ